MPHKEINGIIIFVGVWTYLNFVQVFIWQKAVDYNRC